MENCYQKLHCAVDNCKHFSKKTFIIQVSWLACWSENIQGQTKYVMLNAASRLKGEKDWQKYEVARRLYKHVDKIRATYREDWKSKEMRIRQRAVALYFIDKVHFFLVFTLKLVLISYF